MIKIITILLMLAISSTCHASYRDTNTRAEETGLTPAIHATLCAGVSGYMVTHDYSPWVSFLTPWAVGFAKELTDVNFGYDDILANTVGCAIGVGVGHLIIKKDRVEFTAVF